MTPDLAVLAAALERQITVLAPIGHRLQLAVAHPPIAPYDWQGPASRAYGSLEEQLRSRIRDAQDAVGAALHDSRLAVGQVAAQLGADQQLDAQFGARFGAQLHG